MLCRYNIDKGHCWILKAEPLDIVLPSVTRSEPRTQKAASSRYEQCNAMQCNRRTGWCGLDTDSLMPKAVRSKQLAFFLLLFDRVKTRSQDVDVNFPLEDMGLFIHNQWLWVRLLHLLWLFGRLSKMVSVNRSWCCCVSHRLRRMSSTPASPHIILSWRQGRTLVNLVKNKEGCCSVSDSISLAAEAVLGESKGDTHVS